MQHKEAGDCYSATDAKGMATDNQNARPKSVSPRKDQKSSTPVGESNQKTRAMVANEDGEEAFTCVNLETPRSSGNSKKSNSNRLPNDDEAIDSAASVPRVIMVRSTLK